MSSELCGRAMKVFADAVLCYLRSNALRTLRIASLTGQESVKVSLRAFMRCHDPSSGFARIEDVVNTLVRCGAEPWVRKLGWSYVYEDGEPYFIVPIEGLRKLVKVDEGDLRRALL